jgi:acyl-CoA reductase-like NAD-dependent aldehyde dehydrogenase
MTPAIRVLGFSPEESTPEMPGWFYEPTIVDQLKPGMRLVMEEAFGPSPVSTKSHLARKLRR